MKIVFASRKLSRIFNSEQLLIRNYGADEARIIMRRMAVLQAAEALSEVSHAPPERRHELKGNRKGQFAVDLKHPRRLVFKPNYDQPPLRANGGIDLRQVTSILIIGVEDYHR